MSEFNLLYPRIYEDVGEYTSLRSIANVMHKLMCSTRSVNAVERYMSTCCRVCTRPILDMMNHRMPTYFVTRDLIASMMHTEFRDPINWKELPLPFESGVLVFPRGTLVHPTDGDCSWVGWGRCWKDKNYENKQFGMRPVTGSCDTFSLFTSAFDAPLSPWFHLHFADIGGKEVCSSSTFTLPELHKSQPHTTTGAEYEIPMAKDDDEFVNNVSRLVINVLMFMMARPSMVKNCNLKKRVARRNELTREYWYPNIIGQGYRIHYKKRSEVGESQQHRDEGYWVGGHWKQQPHGPNRSLRKSILVDPYFVDPY